MAPPFRKTSARTDTLSEPIITIVLPTYQRPAMLRRAIRSVLDQTFPDFRVCIYDNASGDETEAVVEGFRKRDSRLEYVCRPNNIGMSPNFVDGANRVETPYFSFLADDDLMLPHFLETALSGFQRYPEAALSILPTLCMNPRGLILLVTNLQWPEGLLLPPSGMLSALRYGNPGLQAMLIRKGVWDEFGGFDEATEPAEEYDFDLRVMARLPVVVYKRPGAIQVVHRSTSTAAGGLNWVWPCFPRMIRKFQDMNLATAARQEAIERLTRLLKRGLIVRVGLRSLSDGKWEDAQRAADLLEQECRLAGPARIIRVAAAICRRLPFLRLLPRALLELRNWQKTVRNMGLWWRYRLYAKLLRISPVEVPKRQTRLAQTATHLES